MKLSQCRTNVMWHQSLLKSEFLSSRHPSTIQVLPIFSSYMCVITCCLCSSHTLKLLKSNVAPAFCVCLQLFPPPGILTPTSSQGQLLMFQMQIWTTRSYIIAKPIPLAPQSPHLPKMVFLPLRPGFPFTLKCQLWEERDALFMAVFPEPRKGADIQLPL